MLSLLYNNMLTLYNDYDTIQSEVVIMSLEVLIVLIIIIIIPLMMKEQSSQIDEYRENKRILELIEENAILINELSAKSYYYSKRYNDKGIYILSNISKNNYKYVGQSTNMYERVRNHTKGRGNPGVFADLRKGDIFTVSFIKLADTNFLNLNDLERHYISKYNSFYNGYNRTRGNK